MGLLMPIIKLTKTTVERRAAPNPTGKQTIYFDTEVKGFGVIISGTTTTKT
jgi:hypothetical protein